MISTDNISSLEAAVKAVQISRYAVIINMTLPTKKFMVGTIEHFVAVYDQQAVENLWLNLKPGNARLAAPAC